MEQEAKDLLKKALENINEARDYIVDNSVSNDLAGIASRIGAYLR